MEESKKRPPVTTIDDFDSTSKKLKPPPHYPKTTAAINNELNDNDDISSCSSIDDELAQELSKLLESAAPFSADQFKVRFLPYPYLMPPLLEPSSNYITINGNEESCGSSFSDSNSSLMASFNTSGLNVGEPVGWWFGEDDDGGAWVEDFKEVARDEGSNDGDGDGDGDDFWDEVLLAAGFWEKDDKGVFGCGEINGSGGKLGEEK